MLVLLIFISGCVNIHLDETEKEETVSQQTEQEPLAKTKIKVSQRSMEMIISPSQDYVVKDIITITVTKAPQNTGTIGFAIIGPGIEAIEKTGPNLGYDSDGRSIEFDTNSYPNNEYTITTIAYPADRQSGAPPLGALQAKIEIRYEESLLVEPPILTAPYKIMVGSCQNPLKSIEDAKQMHANVISVNVFAGSTNEEDGSAIWESPEKKALGCIKLFALAHENSLGTALSVSLANEEQFIVKNFNREKFIQTNKEMLKAYASFAQQNKVPMFTIANEIDSFAGIRTMQTVDRTKLTYDLSKEFIAEARKVYDGKLIIGLAGVEADEVGQFH